jgi:hypothetical protein
MSAVRHAVSAFCYPWRKAKNLGNTMNLNMRAAAILVWLPEGENPGQDSFSPQMVFQPPSPNPEAWWCLEDAIRYVNGSDRGDHKKVPWIKTGDAILGPDQISRAYSALRAARNFDSAGVLKARSATPG